MQEDEQFFMAQQEEGTAEPEVAGESEQKGKKAQRKAEQAVMSGLDETQQRAAAAYAAYLEAEHELERAYKEQEAEADRQYNDALEAARRTCEESIESSRKKHEDNVERSRRECEQSVNEALNARAEAERQAREARNETMERTWSTFTKARK